MERHYLDSCAFTRESKRYGTIPPLSIEECRDMVNRALSDCLAALTLKRLTGGECHFDPLRFFLDNSKTAGEFSSKF